MLNALLALSHSTMDTISLIRLAAPLLVVILFKTLVGSLISRQKHGPYPPGPKPMPIIGNLFDLQIKESGPEYAEWSRKYQSKSHRFTVQWRSHFHCTGGICFATAFGNNVLIVNKQADADELFERRAKLYNDRPQMPMIKL